MKFRTLFAPLLGLGCLALGVYLGRGPLSPESAQPDTDSNYLLDQPGSLLQSTGSSASGKLGGAKSGAIGVSGNSPAADALLGVINNPNGQAAINRFYAMLGKMPSKDIAELIVDIDSYPNHSRRRETREMIIDYLAMADPMKALEVHEDLPTKGIFGKAFKQLGRMNPAEALRVYENLEDAGDRSKALTSIFVGASEINPAGAFELLKKTAEANPSLYHEVFDNWAEMDPTTAAKMALTINKPAERREALKIVGQEWAERDPQAVLDWIGKSDLSSFEREIIRGSAIDAYARRDAKAAMALLDTMDVSARNRALPTAVRELVEQDPDAAATWLREAPDSFAKYRAISEIGWTFGNEAPETAIALAKEIPEMKRNALSGAFRTLASQDLDLAIQEAAAWKDTPEYQNIMGQIASGYGRKNPEEALQWANGLEGDLRNSAVSNVISQLSGNDPNLAIKHLGDLGLGGDDPIFQNAVSNIADNWASQDPVSASEWIDTLPDSNSKVNAISNVADSWARIDPVSASEWIGGLDGGPARDQATGRLVNRIQREDPEMAAIWAGSIGDENQRNNSLSNVFRNWFRVDPQGAQAAMDASTLPEEMKQDYRQRFESQPVGDSPFGGG